ncbi:SDR family NAD(P)-dependent oxidoreductase [Mycobacterium sp. CVI_P3]|uniref:SDR family NAD(P)-dependent oxidoreductase n=1 Tax=Mycobacterium pinniadriaticum TaxID=2994102 RepID=A0ABT3S8I4_9MYCO|nr:SDR family NAD(P)-dependent oxidoreductase [Mycobacterium pinniadriaticum]MCX2929382.1 SDR family NAD(P)-dependent oxidoreductase [Mycobacterium pinniadriaticum]MCX2935806.1 SDR family NAD(P)-dependent oxidoreductase [Mycobacterium pinniadriaticum]
MKTVLITGATAGIGLHCAEQIAARGHHMVLVGRSEDKLAAASTRVRAAGAPRVDALLADFASLTAVDALADQVLATYGHLDVLINNAGGMFLHHSQTQDGIEATFGVNHLAGYLLTERLRPLIVASAPARIVITASSGHYRAAPPRFDDSDFPKGYNGFAAYYRSKLANVLYTRALASQLEGTGVTVNALHPGAVATDIWNSTPGFARPLVALTKRLVMISPAEGGSRVTHLALDPAVAERTGSYFDRNRVKQPSGLARDGALAERLCEVSARLTGIDGDRSTQ